ncbi:MAG TPA: Arc family DNA-binding protein [Spirochaetota bacterium]|nr:Arc family DNA-binding protein [Spirochaetota bacterium]
MAIKTQTISMQDDLLNEIKIKAMENQRSISAEIAYRVKISLKKEKEMELRMT